MLLPESEPGTPLGDVLPLRDDVLLVEPTGNRPDLLAVYGLAREVAALYDLELAPFPGREPDARRRRARSTSRSPTSKGARATSAGSSATSTVGPSPLWLKARLAAAGMRPISNVVDVTNYVMAALGQPAARLRLRPAARAAGSSSAGRRPARRCGRWTASTARSRPATSLIADAERAVALAGIMGGEETEIGEDDDRPSCWRPRTSSRPGSSAAPSGCGSARRARTGGRRASIRTSPGRPPSWPPS